MVALVTGANRGIGLEVCRQLARSGHTTILSARDGKKAASAAATLEASGHSVTPSTLDVNDPKSIEKAQRELMRRFGRIDVLVNNAAILIAEDADLLDTSIDDFRRTFETNLFGAIAVSEAFVPGMIERRFGRVVNVSSGAGQLARMGTYAPAYSISKAALNAFTRQLASATKGSGILVNSADPGWVRTDMGGGAAPRSVEQGADTIVWLATLADKGPTGGFFSDRRQIEW